MEPKRREKEDEESHEEFAEMHFTPDTMDCSDFLFQRLQSFSEWLMIEKRKKKKKEKKKWKKKNFFFFFLEKSFFLSFTFPPSSLFFFLFSSRS